MQGYRVNLTETDKTLLKVYILEKNVNSLSSGDRLKPFTKYTISVAARNKHGFGNEGVLEFMTDEDGREY